MSEVSKSRYRGEARVSHDYTFVQEEEAHLRLRHLTPLHLAPSLRRTRLDPALEAQPHPLRRRERRLRLLPALLLDLFFRLVLLEDFPQCKRRSNADQSRPKRD